MRDLVLWISEGLFFLLNGEQLANTFWIVPWLVVWSLTMASPLLFVFNMRRTGKPPSWTAWAFLFGFFPGLLLAIGPGIVQSQMLSECENVTVTVSTELVQGHEIEMRHCRFKENYYGEFGEWKLSLNPY